MSQLNSPSAPSCVFTSLKFSNDGSKLLVCTAGDVHYVLDAFTGDILARLEGGFAYSDILDSIASRHPIHDVIQPVLLIADA